MSFKQTKDPLRMISIILAVVLILSLIPMLAISAYSRPAVDDYDHGTPAHDTYMTTGSVLQTLKTGFDAMCDIYMEWQGSYTAILFSALQPGVFGERMYFISPVLSILIFVFANLFFFDAILYRLLGTDRRCAFCASAVVILLSMQLLPDGAQGFYVHAYTCSYTWMYSFGLILAGLLARASLPNSSKVYYLLCPLVAFLVAGCNYSTVLLVFLFLLEYCAVLLLLKKHPLIPFLTLGAYALGFFISVLAPGNAERFAITEVDVGAVEAIFQALVDTLQLTAEWTTFPFVLLELAVLFFLYPTVKTLLERFSFRFPILPIIFTYLMVAAGVTPLIYGYGEISTWAGRVFNLLFFMYAILFQLCLCYLMGWVIRVYQNRSEETAVSSSHPVGPYTRFIPGFLVFCGFLVLIYANTGMQDEHYYDLRLSHVPTISAIASLANGDAKGFAGEMDARLPVLYDPAETKPVFRPIQHRPYLLYVADAESWFAEMWAQYYHKESVIIQP